MRETYFWNNFFSLRDSINFGETEHHLLARRFLGSLTNISFDWFIVAFGNQQAMVTNAGYPNDPRKPSAESWCAVALKFLLNSILFILLQMAYARCELQWKLLCDCKKRV